MIAVGIFGGLVGGHILSLTDYYAPPERRLDIHNSGVHRFWLPYFDGSLGQIKKKKREEEAINEW